MKKGIVKFYNDSKGYGFIKDEIFVHSSGLKSQIRQNDQVIFETQKDKKGLNAVNVAVI